MTREKFDSQIYCSSSKLDSKWNGWQLLAAVDESEDYETDITEIWRTPDQGFALLTASGCSCWDGDFSTERFPNLEQLAVRLFAKDADYNPTFHGSLELLKEVFKNL